MPCTSPGAAEDDDARLRRDVDFLTDLLCKAGRAAVNNKVPPDDVLNWWVDHRERAAYRGDIWVKEI